MLRAVNPSDRAAPVGYSQAIEATGASRFLFISGQIGVDAAGETPEGIGAQTQLAMANMAGVLAQAGMSFANLAKLVIYLTREEDLPGFMAAAQGLAMATPPASTLVLVKALIHPALLVEIEAIAVS